MTEEPPAVAAAKPDEWIGAAEAARRLGIKEASLYSYVSRGLLHRRKAPGSRSSLFGAAEVERLAGRGRPRGGQYGRLPPPGHAVQVGAELVIETAITELTEDRLRFRGFDATVLAESWSLENVAELLWTGAADEPAQAATSRGAGQWRATAPVAEVADRPGGNGWRATDEALAAGMAAPAALPAGALAPGRTLVEG